MALSDWSKKRKIVSGILGAVGLILIVVVSFAISLKIAPVSSGLWGPINETSGVALKGFDAVAYHQSGEALPGSDAITAHWMGVTWQFVSEANKATFELLPDQYAPQYGGFCATAVSAGVTADIEPDAWQIVEGKLYVFNGDDPMQAWVKELGTGIIAKGDANWATR